MYMARVGQGEERRYIIRESVEREGRYVSRDLMHLGADPGEYIEYPGGNSFFISQAVEDALREKGLDPGISELEDLFWPFVRPEIRHALRGFVWKSRRKRRPRRLTAFEEDYLRHRLHIEEGFSEPRWHGFLLGLAWFPSDAPFPQNAPFKRAIDGDGTSDSLHCSISAVPGKDDHGHGVLPQSPLSQDHGQLFYRCGREKATATQ